MKLYKKIVKHFTEENLQKDSEFGNGYANLETDILNGEYFKQDLEKVFPHLKKFEEVYSDGSLYDYTNSFARFTSDGNEFICLCQIPLNSEAECYGMDCSCGEIDYYIILLTEKEAEKFETRKGFMKIVDIIDGKIANQKFEKNNDYEEVEYNF